jgi:hypothetical protein
MPYSGCRLRNFKSVGVDVNAGLDERLIVSSPGAEMRIAIVFLPQRELLRCVIDQQSELH